MGFDLQLLSCFFLECPEGYTYQFGDVLGMTIATASKLDSIDDCAKMCDITAGCKGIEWSPTRRQCILINKANSDGPKYLDFLFCSKGKESISSNLIEINYVAKL